MHWRVGMPKRTSFSKAWLSDSQTASLVMGTQCKTEYIAALCWLRARTFAFAMAFAEQRAPSEVAFAFSKA